MTLNKVVEMTKEERSTLCYLESCCVDDMGFVESRRFNKEDLDNIKKFKRNALIRFEKLPNRLLGKRFNPNWSHYCQLSNAGFELAAECRKFRAYAGSESVQAKEVITRLVEMGKLQ